MSESPFNIEDAPGLLPIGPAPQSAEDRAAAEMTLDALLSFDAKNDPDCLLGFRYLGRSGGLVIVAPSGVGKSVLSFDLAACAALGRPFFSVKILFPLRVLYVQAEDDLGDVAEAVQGFVKTHRLGEKELAQLKTRLRIVRWNDAAGGKFLARLEAEFAVWPFDFVIINPLFSFCGCAVSEQEPMSAFLRNGLNPILNKTRAACVIVHHTNKPLADPKNKGERSNNDLSYSGSGSAELTNWARAYITLQNVKAAGDGVYKMGFTKRGTRAGILDGNGRPSTSVLIEHAKDGLCWLPSDWKQEARSDGKFKTKFDLARASAVYDPKLSWPDNKRRIAGDLDMSERVIHAYRNQLEAV
jgi:hypothetical protein